MKKRLLAGWLLCAAMISFASCSDNDDLDLGADKVPAAVSDNFKSQFPDAVDVSWEQKRGYFVADFDLRTNGADCEAWYTAEGVCKLSEEDLSLTRLKAEYASVWEAYQQTAYAQNNFTIDDVDLLRRNVGGTGEAEVTVKLEVEKGNEEFDLYYTPQGVLLKEVADTDGDDDYEI